LDSLGIKPENITVVVSTHGHSDHTGNNNLFLNARQHIVGYCIHNKDEFLIHPFDKGIKKRREITLMQYSLLDAKKNFFALIN